MEQPAAPDPKTVTFVTDVGKVITEFLQGRTAEEALRDNAYLQVPPYEGAFDTIALAVQEFWRVGIVSRCGPTVQGMVETWLRHWKFFEHTGFDRRNLHFNTGQQQKVAVIQKEFGGATYFLDDTLEVLLPMSMVVRYRLLYGANGEQEVPAGILQVRDWRAVRQFIGLA